MTAPSLDQLADTLRSLSDQLDEDIKASADPTATPMQQLRSLDTQIALQAAAIAELSVEELQNEVAAAIDTLNNVVGQAKDAIASLQNVKAALGIVAAVLDAAVAIGTGNPLNAATGIVDLAQSVSAAIDA
jgi:ElaB/YqjD/DUF883 family membrane-anchored ribosome-binding protein